MRRCSAALVSVLVAIALPALARPASTRWPPPLDRSLRSAALRDEIGVRVYLPPGYDTTRRRYPVVYFLHGLPASPSAYRSLDFLRQAMEKIGRSAILVTVQGARRSEVDGEYLDGGPGHNWETAIAVELPRFIDAHFRTIAARRGRAVVGLSAGGYGAMLLGLHHLARFGVIESWSGYFRPTDPAGKVVVDLGSPGANGRASAHSFVGSLHAAFARLPTFLGFYVGASDGRFRAENEALDRELTRARVPHLFRLYPGGHEHGLWQREAARWLGLALDHLSRPA
jgi:S-formylglutathione hydrolase FrmB